MRTRGIIGRRIVEVRQELCHADGQPAWDARRSGPRQRRSGASSPSTKPRKIDGVLIDASTASTVCKVHDALSPTNRAKFAALPVAKMALVAWKLVS